MNYKEIIKKFKGFNLSLKQKEALANIIDDSIDITFYTNSGDIMLFGKRITHESNATNNNITLYKYLIDSNDFDKVFNTLYNKQKVINIYTKNDFSDIMPDIKDYGFFKVGYHINYSHCYISFEFDTKNIALRLENKDELE